ncbi:MAG: hypothetical protein AB9917_18955 [Negativicutes bacterium]
MLKVLKVPFPNKSVLLTTNFSLCFLVSLSADLSAWAALFLFSDVLCCYGVYFGGFGTYFGTEAISEKAAEVTQSKVEITDEAKGKVNITNRAGALKSKLSVLHPLFISGI